MSLRFVPNRHLYYLDGNLVKGVTTLISGGLPKPALPPWAARTVAEWVADHQEQVSQLWDAPRSVMIAALKETPWAKRDAAAVRGTDIHALAEKIVHGEEVEVPEHLVAPVEGYVRWLEAFDVQPILTEVPVANRRWNYAGKLDIVCKLPTLSDETWLLDWKSAAGVYGESALQTSGYARCEFFVNPPDWDAEIPMPHIDRIGVVHITEDGTTLHPLGDIDAAFKVFTHVAFVARQTDWIKTLVGDPIPEPDKESAA